MSAPIEHFRFCPRCGRPLAQPSRQSVVECSECDFSFYLSPAIAVAAFIRRADGRVLFIRRAKEPAQGKLAPPGGFIDAQERAEEALRREVREEVGLELSDAAFLCSQLNSYHYREVTYPVLDLFFTARGVGDLEVDAAEVNGVEWLDPATVDLEEVAFPSMRAALRLLRRL